MTTTKINNNNTSRSDKCMLFYIIVDFFFMTIGAYLVERWNEKFWAHQFAHNLDSVEIIVHEDCVCQLSSLLVARVVLFALAKLAMVA